MQAGGLVDETSYNNVVKTITREHHWHPDIISGLFHDGIDRFGLLWWYNDILEANKELKESLKDKNKR